MKELPILFSTPMVQAIMENRKTMTRRMAGLEKVNECPDEWIYNPEIKPAVSFFNKKNGFIATCKPRYKKGDYIWLRETYFDAQPFKSAPLFANGNDYYYRADKDVFIGEHKWKSSLFMPKAAARIWLEVTGVRCERLQDISEADAIAEGVESIDHPDFRKYKEYVQNEYLLKYPTHSFFSLWRKINGKNSVAANPWVFIYEFKRIEK